MKQTAVISGVDGQEDGSTQSNTECKLCHGAEYRRSERTFGKDTFNGIPFIISAIPGGPYICDSGYSSVKVEGQR